MTESAVQLIIITDYYNQSFSEKQSATEDAEELTSNHAVPNE